MAVAEQPTYISIPPPPLPEFYLTKQRRSEAKRSSSSSSTTKPEDEILVIRDPPASGDGAYDGRPRTVLMPQVPPAPLFVVPPTAPNEPQPLAIYHICRICLRPRSARYHRDHPIPLTGVPPPPGICRRCRVTSAEETKKVAEIVTKSESNAIKLGAITPFIPDGDIVSNQEMRRMKLEKYLRGRSDERRSSHHRSKSRDITYRYVRVVDGQEEEAPKGTKVAFTSQDAIDNFNYGPPPEPPRAPKTLNTSMQVQPTANPPSVSAKAANAAAVRNLDSAKASVSTKASSSQPGPIPAVQTSAKVTKYWYPEHTDSEIRRIARDEVERYASTFNRPERIESDIRRISREEVERYRQAERKLEAHPRSYSHGRLVPIERRIDVESDVVETKPWAQPTKQKTPLAPASTRPKPQSTQRMAVEREIVEAKPASQPATQETPSVKASARTKSHVTQKNVAFEADEPGRIARSNAESWGPKWRRDLSLERRSRSERDLRQVKTVTREMKEDKKNTPTAPGFDSEPPTSVKLREVYDVVPESDPPRWSSRAEPYVVKVTRKPPEDKDNIIEVIEEIDLPPRSRAASYRRQESDRGQPARKDPPVTERVRELQADSRRQDMRAQTPLSFQPPGNDNQDKSSGPSKPSDREYWYDDRTVRTVDTRSTRQHATSGSGGTPQDTRRKASPPRRQKSVKSSTPSGVGVHSAQASEKTYWPREQATEDASKNPTSRSDARPPYPEQDVIIDRIVWPTDTPTERSARTSPSKSKQSAKSSDVEYEYRVRTVQPVDRLSGRQRFDDRSATEQVVHEEYFETRRRPGDGAPPAEPRNGRRPVTEQVVHEEQWDTRRHPFEEAHHPEQLRERRPATERVIHEEHLETRQRPFDEAPPREQRRDRRDSNGSSRVRFSDKVDISPTPPGSDASSSAFRSYHSFGRGNGRRVDGPEDLEAGDKIAAAEYERRGRTRSRDMRTGFHYARDLVRTMGDGWEGGRVNSKHKDSEKKDGARSHTWVSGGRPLERALSESPSREELIHGSRPSKSDGRGPYRVQEKVSGSMRAQDGSREP